MYNNSELNGKLLPELKAIAKEIGIKRTDQYKKKELIEIIIEKQNELKEAEPTSEIPQTEPTPIAEPETSVPVTDFDDVIGKIFDTFSEKSTSEKKNKRPRMQSHSANNESIRGSWNDVEIGRASCRERV